MNLKFEGTGHTLTVPATLDTTANEVYVIRRNRKHVYGLVAVNEIDVTVSRWLREEGIR